MSKVFGRGRHCQTATALAVRSQVMATRVAFPKGLKEPKAERGPWWARAVARPGRWGTRRRTASLPRADALLIVPSGLTTWPRTRTGVVVCNSYLGMAFYYPDFSLCVDVWEQRPDGGRPSTPGTATGSGTSVAKRGHYGRVLGPEGRERQLGTPCSFIARKAVAPPIMPMEGETHRPPPALQAAPDGATPSTAQRSLR